MMRLIVLLIMHNQQTSQKKEIKSVKQISDEMRNAKKQFDVLINCLSIPQLSMEEDLERRTPTIEMILKDLPTEQRLKEMLQHPFADTPQIREKILANYKGKYDIIKRAGQNIRNLKHQAERLYYLAAELNLYKIKNQFEAENKEQIKLKSYEISKNQNMRIPRYQRNTISSSYIRQLKNEEIKTSTNTATSDYLHLGETLLHINLYDSINGEKAFQYVCHGEQTLLQVVSRFYCLIARLQGKEAIHHVNSYCLIEENFYFHGPMARKKIAEIISFSSQMMEDEYKTGNQEQANMVYEMSKTKIKSMRVVFGRPYLFRHLDGCDHIIIFKDLRILTENQTNDPTKKDKYPLVVFEGRMRRRKCDGCRIKFAEWVSLNDPLKSGKHLYVCAPCHENLHTQATHESHTFIRYLHD